MHNQESERQDLFIHRDLSWLAFNERVLEEAEDDQNPLLERAKFLAIFSQNLDEFFMVRVGGLRRLIDSQYNKKDDFGCYPQEIYESIKAKTQELVGRLYAVFEGKLKKELEKNSIFIKKYSELNITQQKFAKRFFDTTIFPVLTPMAVDPGRPFPVLPSKTLAFAVLLKRYDKPHFAIVPIAQNIPRLIRVPSEKEEHSFILADDIVKEHLSSFFKGFKLETSLLFRLNRDSEMSGEEEYSSDLLKAIMREVKKRPKARVVYLEAEKNSDSELLDFLCESLEFSKEEVSFIKGDLDLSFLFSLFSQVDVPKLFFPTYTPKKKEYENIFEHIKAGDFFLHVPFESFSPTVDLIQTAARDQDVLAIKMTLYRVPEDSAMIAALKEAAQNKKQVTVLVELKARFNEEQNIQWSKQLEEAGCHVIYGIAGIKVHSKMALVVRKEEGRIRRYVHLSTGNYNEKTANVYTDIGYFTANDDFARDISDVFNVVTGYSLPSRWQRVVSGPLDLRGYFFDLIDQEIAFQKKYRNGFIFAKMNSLEDRKIIQKLYEASQAGVTIQLIVRGICCLVPGIKGLSEHIQVKSIVGRFLEHTRIFIFHYNGNDRIFLSSADWMERNFDRRIEILFEIYNQDIKDRLYEQMQGYWRDDTKSRYLTDQRHYERPKPEKEKNNAQEQLMKLYGG